MKYRQIDTNFWDNDDYISDLSDKEQLLYLHLLTTGKANMAGIFEVSQKFLKNRFFLSDGELKSIKDKFEISRHYFFYNNWVYVTNKYRPVYSTAPAVLEAFQREFNSIPFEVKDYLLSKNEYELPIVSQKNDVSFSLNKKKEIKVTVTYKDKVKVKDKKGSPRVALGYEMNENVDPDSVPL